MGIKRLALITCGALLALPGVVAGGKAASLTNARGIRMDLIGRTIGREFSLDLSGINNRPR